MSESDHPSQSQLWSSSQSSETHLLGFVIADIVGIQYYSSTVNGREMVSLVRDPPNTYDSKALRVLNARFYQVDHIERAVAAILSPLIDSNLIVVEGIVPNSRRKGNGFRIPCQVHVFCRVEAFGIVRDARSSLKRERGEMLMRFSCEWLRLRGAMTWKSRKNGETVVQIKWLCGW